MKQPRNRYSIRGHPHGLREVTQCLNYIEDCIEEGVLKTKAISSCAKCFKIPRSSIWRWWKVFELYGENHIILNEHMRHLKKRYGRALTSVSDRHVQELKRVVDSHPEYYLDEFVTAMARICGVFIIHLQFLDY